MNITIDRATILPALTRAAAIADSKSTMPILAGVRLVATTSRLTISATDLNLATTTEMPCKGKAGTVVVPAKALRDVVANLPDGPITLRVDDAALEVTAGRVRMRKPLLPARDLPAIPSTAELRWSDVNAGDLAAMLARTLISVCTDETRFHLNGVLLLPDRAVSTDGHRLSTSTRTIALPVPPTGVIVPRLGVIALGKLIADAAGVELAYLSPHLFARVDDAVLAIKLIDAQFPPWRQVIPPTRATTVVVGRGALIDAVKRAALIASDTRGLRLTVDPEADDPLTLSSDSPDAGDVREGVAATVTGPAVATGCAPRYLADALHAMAADDVSLDLGGPLDPWALRPVGGADDLFVIMPMRLT